jgi:hypothetical protein
MKALIITGLILASSSAMALGFKVSESTNGTNKYCSYSNGVVITISIVSLCPLSI